MIIDNAITIIGPFALTVNLLTMLFYLRPKHGVFFTLAVYVVSAVAGHIFMIITGTLDTSFEKLMGLPFLPVCIWLFNGQLFQKIFVFFLQHQITALITFLVEMLVGLTIGYESPNALTMFLALSFLLLSIYMAAVIRFGRRLFDRIFVDGRKGDWILYSFGAMFSFVFVVTVQWTTVGKWMYIGFALFILWSLGVLCFTIINTHEKTAQAYRAETLILQMSAMREQTDAEKKHRDDIEILRHDMRHEMGVIMELFRTGKSSEAEAVYEDWQKSLAKAIPAAICAEPVLNAVFSRFERRAKEKNIILNVNSNIPDTMPIDTIKLSVMVSNSLENAMTAADKVPERDKRVIGVKLIQSGLNIGLEVTNPCAEAVEFDGRGLPVTHEAGHGIGVRSIAAFAEDNGYLLDFIYLDSKFTIRMIMGLRD